MRGSYRAGAFQERLVERLSDCGSNWQEEVGEEEEEEEAGKKIVMRGGGGGRRNRKENRESGNEARTRVHVNVGNVRSEVFPHNWP